MNILIHKKILFSAFSAFVLFVALFVAVVYHSHVKTTEINNADKNTLVVLKATEEVFKDMTNLETGYRGYILTSNPIFLEPYQQAVSEYEYHLEELNKAELQEKTQQNHVALLGVLVRAQIEAAKDLVAKKEKDLAGEDAIKQGLVRGKEKMDSIRLVAGLIEDYERVNLAMYDSQKAENARNAFLLVLGFSLIALLVFIGFSVTINKNVDLRLKAEEKLVGMNRQLEQKVADRTLQLQNANNLLEGILNRISDGFVALDSNWCYTYVNKVAGQVLNRTPESLLGKNMWEVFPEGRQTPFYQLYLNVMEKQEATRIDEYFAPWDVWLENHLYPSPNGMSIYFSNITQKKKAEQKLEENERNLKQAELAAKFGHWKLLLDENLVYSSDGARMIYGVDKNVFTSEEVMSFRLPEYNSMLNEAMRALIEDNKPFNVEFKIKRQSDGAIVDVQSVAEYNAAERTVFGVIKDITASKNTERALNREKDLSESIINSLPGVFSMFDDKGRIVRWNKNCETVSGYAPEEISKMTPLDFIDRDYIDVAMERLENAFYEGDGEIETNLVTKTGHKIPYYYKGHVENIEGTSFFIGVGIDISARKKAEESHRESEANLKRAELVAKLGHWKMNLNDKMIYGSEGTMQIYGIAKPVISYDEVAQLRMPEYDEVMTNAMEALLRYNKPLDVEYKMKRKSDGKILDIRLLSEFDVKTETLFGIVQDITERKNAEYDLLESEKKYRMLFYSSPMPMFMISLPSYKFVDVNEAAIKHYGYTRQEFLNMNVRDLRPEEDKAKFDAEVVPATLTGTNYLGKWKHVKKNREVRTVELTGHEVKFGDEKQRLILINDVTEREEALEKLKKNINELSVYKAALDEAAIIAITDQHGIINHVNDNFCTVSKYSREELIGADHRIINSGHHSKEFMHDLWQTIAQGKIWTGEIKNKAKDGNYYWVYSTIIPFLNEEGKPYQHLSIRWDITTRKNAEEEIQRLYNKLLVANAQLTTVLNTLPANIAVLDAQGKITSVNKAWQQFAESNNLPGNKHGVDDNYITVCEQTTAEDEPIALKMAESIRQILKGELDELSLEYPCHSPTEKRWFRAEVRPLAEEGNTGAVVMHVNITERKLAEETVNELNNQLEIRVMERTTELTQANKALEAFSYSVSHDLRAPVRAVIGFTRIIQSEYGDTLPPDLAELFSHIDNSGKRMNAIIDDMLTLAKYEKVQVNAVKVDMTKLFSQVWDNILFTTHHRAKLQLSELPEVEADQSMIEQVVVNLVSNAVKYSSKKPNPVVTVGFEKSETSITIFVKDNGAGFDMEQQDRLFGAFQRLHGSSEFEGTGVGLLLVKKIIERHGGQVWAEGEVDKGATFYFSLPNISL